MMISAVHITVHNVDYECYCPYQDLYVCIDPSGYCVDHWLNISVVSDFFISLTERRNFYWLFFVIISSNVLSISCVTPSFCNGKKCRVFLALGVLGRETERYEVLERYQLISWKKNHKYHIIRDTCQLLSSEIQNCIISLCRNVGSTYLFIIWC